MKKIAEIASRYEIDPSDDDAVDGWYENEFFKLPTKERMQILAEILEETAAVFTKTSESFERSENKIDELIRFMNDDKDRDK